MRSSRSSSNASTRSISESIDSLPIFVKLLSGEVISLTLPPTTTIATLRQLLSLRTSLPPSNLRLLHAGRHLTTTTADPTLVSLNILPNSTLELTAPVRGGMPPKKMRCTFKDCKDAAQRIVGDCGFCSGHFCGKHRMLEDHKCSGLEDCKKESHERNAMKLESERTMVVKGI
ncbi:hypothetical protein MMC34_006036 [Xylographa carneopallida]|nr:hypothetical protein [Xylographa carneopallida]